MYFLRCNSCKWWLKTENLSGLIETTTCAKCSGRKFRCPSCGYLVKMLKLYDTSKEKK